MSEQKVTLYHCTLTKYVPKILKKGILLMQRSNWVVSGTGERYGGGYIFAFDNYKDAVTWAMKWDWNLNDNFGTGQISIVEFLANPEDWSEDNSDPLTRYSYRGKWLKSNKRVPPEDIQNTVVCTESVIQAARSQNPAKGGVQIPAYLRTPKLKPYIEQGLITQEIVDLYEKAIDAAKRFAEEEIELNKKYGEYNWVYPAVFHAVHGYSNRLLIAINNAKLDNEQFPHFGNTYYRSSENLSSTFAQRLIQQARKKMGKRDDRDENPRPRNQVFRVKRDYGGYIELTVAVVDGYRVAYLSKNHLGVVFEVGKPRNGGGIGSYRFYALNSDGTPDLELYAEDFSDGGDRGKWSLVGSEKFNHSYQYYHDTRKSALRSLVEIKASGREDNPRPKNPAKGGVQIPAYLRTPKLKPYIEQGLITQEIVDLYEQAHELAKGFIEIERHQDQNTTPLTPEKAILLNKVCSVGNKIYDLLNRPPFSQFPYSKDDFPFMRAASAYGDRDGSAVGLEMIQKYRGIMRKSLRDNRDKNPDDPNDTSWVPKRRAPLKRDYEDELESYDTEIKPSEDTELRERAKKFLEGGNALKRAITAKYESPLAKYAPRAAVTRFRVEVPENRVLVYGYDPLLRFGEGAFFCDLYQRFSDNDEAKKLVDIGWELNDIGNNEVLSVIEDYDLSEYIPFEHLANLQRGKPFDRADNPSSRRANPEVSVELSVPARFEITKAFLEREYTDVVERGYAIGYLRHLLYDTRKPETNEISQDRRTEIAKTVKAESENDD